MAANILIGFLFLYIIARECFFLYSTHKLINKIMSTDFHNYQYALNSAKPGKPDKAAEKTKEDDETPEDLDVLSGFGMM